MTIFPQSWYKNPCWMLGFAILTVGFAFSPVLWGFAPLSGDPELMYQPIKAELAQSLAQGCLPFWSDRFGLGVPLIAESHVAAFYPPNWIAYRLLNVGLAYRILLWLHMLALATTTFALGRYLKLTPAGAALTAVTLCLCGFQAIHAVHEPFYHLMPYLPLCLLFGYKYIDTCKLVWLVLLALAWGVQLTLGHFQIQMWTGGLVLLTGAWRTAGQARTATKVLRVFGLALGLGWGAAIAYVQLRLTWELTQVAGFNRPSGFLQNYLFPPAHWAQFVLPEVYLGQPGGRGEKYWGNQGTTPGEACSYIGVTPLVLACLGYTARDRQFAPWRWLAPASLALATMPGWWADGFSLLLALPGFGWFRAPARYTLLTSLALAFLAGKGLDPAISPKRFRSGLVLAILLGALGWTCTIWWTGRTDFQMGIGPRTLPLRYAGASIAWATALIGLLLWYRCRDRMGLLLSSTVLELVPLLFLGPVAWHQEVNLATQSPVLHFLQNLPAPGLVASRLQNLPIRANLTVAFPALGIIPPPPNYLLEPSIRAPASMTAPEFRWQRRFGVTHGVWGQHDQTLGLKWLATLNDQALDRILGEIPAAVTAGLGPWRIVEIPDPFPLARIATQLHTARSWGHLYTTLSEHDAHDQAWFLKEDHPPILAKPMATDAAVINYDGRTAQIRHNGSCVLIVRRTYYPGWSYRLDGGISRPVLKVDGGLQGVPIEGSGVSQVTFEYQPTGWSRAFQISLTAITLAVISLVLAITRAMLPQASPLEHQI